MQLLSTIGFLAATCTTIAFVPQVVQAYRTDNTEAISLGMYVLFVIGISLWLLYGILGVDWPLIVANTITLGLSVAILLLKLKHLRLHKRTN